MAEYIDRGAAIAKLTALEVAKPSATMADAKRLLADMPTADVVPVVRCKDCASTRKKDEYESIYLCDEVLICTNCEDGWQPVRPNHFCGYGKRKDEAQNE